MANAKKPKVTPPNPELLRKQREHLITEMGDQAYGVLVNLFNLVNNSKTLSNIVMSLKQIENEKKTPPPPISGNA